MERSAFARARSFLNYHPVAKWSSLAAAVGTSVLYVVLLVLLGLFADLIVNRGQIPAFYSLSHADREAFQKNWEDPLSHFPAYGEGEGPPDREKAAWRKVRARLAKEFSN